MPRDPRTDPRPGDVLRRPLGGHSVYVIHVTDVFVVYAESYIEPIHVLAMTRISFDRWARDADVVHHADVVHVAQEGGLDASP